MHWEMPIGIDNFGELRRGHYYFVDKTAFIRQLIDGHSKVMLLTRPRRFGKTLTLSMADWFFSIEKETQSRHLFEGLAIEQAGPEYMEHRGRYPVIFISLKDLKNLTWDAMFDSFRTLIRNWYTAHAYLGESDRFDPDVRTRFLDLKRGQAGAGEMAGSLALLLQMLHGYYGKKVILLLDEYDAPIQQAWECGFYEECISFMKQLMGSALKGNDDLDFAILSGVLQVAKESIFSDLNNLDVCSVLSTRYDDVIGFTSGEVAKMAADLQQESQLPDIRAWYDGYHFGHAEIYNPWSVIHFFRNQMVGDYWVNTSGNGLIREMLRHITPETVENLTTLLYGKSVTVLIREGVIYEDIGRDEDALYTMLLTTGYLTAQSWTWGIGGLRCRLIILNREIQDIYRIEILDRASAGLSVHRLDALLSDLVEGHGTAFADKLERYLCQYASVYDTANKESFYHGFLLGMTALVLSDYVVESNRESGYGRFDMALIPKEKQRAGVIMEFKIASQENELEKKAREALQQILKRQYDAEFQKQGVSHLWLYGIAFYGKKVCVKTDISSRK